MGHGCRREVYRALIGAIGQASIKWATKVWQLRWVFITPWASRWCHRWAEHDHIIHIHQPLQAA